MWRDISSPQAERNQSPWRKLLRLFPAPILLAGLRTIRRAHRQISGFEMDCLRRLQDADEGIFEKTGKGDVSRMQVKHGMATYEIGRGLTRGRVLRQKTDCLSTGETKMQLVSSKTQFTTATLRQGLVEDLEALRSGKITGATARSRAYLAKQVIDTIKIEVVAAQMALEAIEPVALLEAA